jgi:hypothetical protein
MALMQSQFACKRCGRKYEGHAMDGILTGYPACGDIIQTIDAQIASLLQARAILLGPNIKRGPDRRD